MKQKEGEIEKQLGQLKNMERFIAQMSGKIGRALSSELGQPELVEKKEEYLLWSRVDGQGEEKLAEKVAEHVKACEESGLGMGSVGAACRREDLNQGHYDKYAWVYTKLDKKIAALKPRVAPAGFYAQVCYKGYLGNMERPYKLLSDWAKERKISLGELWYEDFLLDELTVNGYEEYVVRVSVPVEKMGEKNINAHR